ncbi:hypothetical protein CEXT_715171 [Caerostris extrusa]|uniref:Uncharacterized protein n=1 Tax=Caerostris extrusa TaxID=172846 RepID=A0AAV4WZU1_CAEEX|nr:hypothetical protein CEXT_715171 [Caerostris extrusa]
MPQGKQWQLGSSVCPKESCEVSGQLSIPSTKDKYHPEACFTTFVLPEPESSSARLSFLCLQSLVRSADNSVFPPQRINTTRRPVYGVVLPEWLNGYAVQFLLRTLLLIRNANCSSHHLTLSPFCSKPSTIAWSSGCSKFFFVFSQQSGSRKRVEHMKFMYFH